jgi:peroxiredoxin Q/BCP
VKAGDQAPPFRLPRAGGSSVGLEDFLGKRNLVVYFYPKDFTSGCTKEACSFRDSYEVFKKQGAEVIGISSDSEDSHESFAKTHRLPFILLSDRDGSVRKAYGVKSTLGIVPGRVTFIIDKNGIIRHMFSSQARPEAHIAEALRIVKLLA